MAQDFVYDNITSGTINSGTAGQLPYFSTNGNVLTGGLLANVNGTTIGDNAAAGKVGELIENSASGVGISSATATMVCSISLTAGDWDVWGNTIYAATGTTATNGYGITIGTSVALASFPFTLIAYGSSATGGQFAVPAEQYRVSLASTTTYYLVAYAAFGTSTMTVSGYIGARRRR